MKITVDNVTIQGTIGYDLLGYDTSQLDRIDRIIEVRPDIDPTQIRSLTRNLMMTINYTIKKKKYRKTLIYKPGFCFDTASVPNIMKWLIDNDGANMLVPSLYHDAGFALHFDTRKFTDAMFRGLVRYYGKKHKVRFYRLKAFIAWCGPASPIGKKIYNGCDPEEHFNYRLCVEY